MAGITAAAVNEFRKMTGLGLMECKKMLQETEGDIQKALTLAKERALVKAEKRADRATEAGRLDIYMHHDNRSAVLVELNCETDFVARNDDFIQACKDIAVHIMAASPLCVRREELDPQEIEEQRRIFTTQVQDKPPQIQEKIVDGKLQSWYGEVVLMDQKYVKDDSKTIAQMLTELTARTGENIRIARFARFVVGETPDGSDENGDGDAGDAPAQG